jgi:hypothetical protein
MIFFAPESRKSQGASREGVNPLGSRALATVGQSGAKRNVTLCECMQGLTADVVDQDEGGV